MKPEVHLILTVDYEIFGNGTGCVEKCILEPAQCMMNVVEPFQAPLTFFVEVLEFIAMEKNELTVTQANMVVNQLKHFVELYHDVQLHLHPQFLDATRNDSGWIVSDKWRCGDESLENMKQMIKYGKNWLEGKLCIDHPLYRCNAFRAGGWCIQPSEGTVEALLGNGFHLDSTVAPGFVNRGRGEWSDFRSAPVMPNWKTEGDVCASSSNGLWELPIVTGKIGKFKHLQAVKTARSFGEGGMARGCKGSYQGVGSPFDSLLSKLYKIERLGHVMLDFSTMPANILIEITQQWITQFSHVKSPVPLVAIAHTKNFTEYSAYNLELYLEWAKKKGFIFSTYAGWMESTND